MIAVLKYEGVVESLAREIEGTTRRPNVATG